MSRAPSLRFQTFVILSEAKDLGRIVSHLRATDHSAKEALNRL